jgi:hypothetical protein
VFSVEMANEEWEVEISPSSRYDTESELPGDDHAHRAITTRIEPQEDHLWRES